MKKKEKKIMLIASVIIFAIALCIFALTLMHYWPYWFGLEKWNVYASVNVTSGIGGFDLNGTALIFGKMGLGGSSKKYITIDNSHNFPILVKISAKGSIVPLLRYDNNIVVGNGEAKNITFSAVSERNTTLGFYEGFVHFKTVPAV
jgi:hypothetical protein